ncbi:MAG: Magnesium and cobalt efflux protein CorC [Candidatus Anoxychlamydiales bacterium]|nr:Magnesium and cobalt efflux protein CorC [Candidatus Anoxychlamydiales bacterium]
MLDTSLFVNSLLFFIFFFIGAISLTAFNVAILKLGKFQSREALKTSLFIGKSFLLKGSWEKFYVLVSVTKHMLYLLYAISAFLFLTIVFPTLELHHGGYIFLLALIIVIFFMLVDFLIRYITRIGTKTTLKVVSVFTSLYILVFLVLTFVFWLLSIFIFKKMKQEKEVSRSFVMKDKVLEMIKASELSTTLSASDQNTIASFITFKEKVAREVMIPRIDIFAIDAKTTIKDACIKLLEDNYSRIPVFSENLDNIIGMLMYKDLLRIYSKSFEDSEIFNQSVDTIVKPIIYAPENKKIAKLFQEFKNKKIHLAIIVNEYGGTEGIITIEDILEEVVGEIEDEYDIGEDRQFWRLPSGSIIVDAKMSIIDLEDELKIKIPHSVEYETIGGYIFHIAGTIPTKGWKIHLEDFEIEVLISNERCIEKIRITPTKIKDK